MGNEGSKSQGQQQKGRPVKGQASKQPQKQQSRTPQARPQQAKGGKGGRGQQKAVPVLVWGSGGAGQLGLGARAEAEAPVTVPRLASLGLEVHQVDCGPTHAAFVAASGAVYVSGSGDSFRLGLGDREPRREPEVVEFTVKSPCVQVACGETFTLFLTQRGNVLACGTSKDGALGLGYSISAKFPMKTGLGEIRKIAAAKSHAAAISNLGKVYTWGSIAEGKLGHASDPSAALQGREAAPKMLDNAYTRGKRFVDVACGNAHTIMVTEFGEVATCGRGEEGQLGYGGRQEHTAVRTIELVDDDDDENEDAEEADTSYVGIEEAKKKKLQKAHRAVRCFASGNASGAITAKGDVWLWGNGELLPQRVKLPEGERALLLSLHPTNSLILTASRSVYSVDLSEAQVAECLEAVSVDSLASSGVAWVSNGGTYFAVACGGPLPSLDETRSRVVEAVEDRRAAKEQADNRKELFGRAKKPNRPGKREIDKVEVQGDTTLSKMKADLFAVPAKKKQPEEAPPDAPALLTDDAAEDMDMDEFKAALFQSAGGAPPVAAAPAPAQSLAPSAAVQRSNPAGMPEDKFVEADPEARNALFAAPAKKKAAPEVVNPFATSTKLAPEAPSAASPTPVVEPVAPAPAAPEPGKGIELRMDLLTPKNLAPSKGVEELFEGDLLSDDDDDDDDLC